MLNCCSMISELLADSLNRFFWIEQAVSQFQTHTAYHPQHTDGLTELSQLIPLVIPECLIPQLKGDSPAQESVVLLQHQLKLPFIFFIFQVYRAILEQKP